MRKTEIFQLSSSGLPVCPALLIFAVELFTGATAVAANTVSFRFAPPTPADFTVTVVGTKTKEMGKLGTTTDETVAKASMNLRRAGSGYTLASKPLSFLMKRDGREVKHPLFAVLGDISTTLKIDAKGKATAISGFENLTDKMKQMMPPELFKAIAQSVNAQALEAKELAEWQGRVGYLVGQEFEIGAGYVSESEFPLPNGRTVPFFTKLKAAEFVTVAGKRCVRIEFQYNSNPQAFAGFASEVMEGVSKLADPSDQTKMSVKQTYVSISGEGSRVIDPATMFIYSEKTSRTIKMTMAVPQKGEVPMVMTETRQYKYQYK